MSASQAHVRVGLMRGFVAPSAIRVGFAPARGPRPTRCGRDPISTAAGLVGGVAIGLAAWAAIIALVA